MEYQIITKELIEEFHPNMEINNVKLSSKLKNLCFFIFFLSYADRLHLGFITLHRQTKDKPSLRLYNQIDPYL